MPVCLKIKNALDAAEFTRRGGEWNPDVHIIVPNADEAESLFVQDLLDKNATDIESYAVAPCLGPDVFSVELQFRNKSVGNEFRKAYRRGFGKGGVVPKAKQTKSRAAKRRLPTHRMYKLRDGEFFWYFAKWDSHGNVVGKIYDPLADCLENKVVHRSVLEEAELVPKGEEPWSLGS